MAIINSNSCKSFTFKGLYFFSSLYLFTYICGSRCFEGPLQQLGPKVGQVLVQVEGDAPIVLTQVAVELCKQRAVLGVQGAEGGQHLLQ